MTAERPETVYKNGLDKALRPPNPVPDD